VSFKEIEREVLAFSDRERAALVATLLDTLPDPETDVSDAEVRQRERELDSGTPSLMMSSCAVYHRSVQKDVNAILRSMTIFPQRLEVSWR